MMEEVSEWFSQTRNPDLMAFWDLICEESSARGYLEELLLFLFLAVFLFSGNRSHTSSPFTEASHYELL